MMFLGSFVGSAEPYVQHCVAELDRDFAIVHNFVDLGF